MERRRRESRKDTRHAQHREHGGGKGENRVDSRQREEHRMARRPSVRLGAVRILYGAQGVIGFRRHRR